MMDFTDNVIPHYNKEVGPNKWQLTFLIDGKEKVMPHIGTIEEIHAYGHEWLKAHYPDARMA